MIAGLNFLPNKDNSAHFSGEKKCFLRIREKNVTSGTRSRSRLRIYRGAFHSSKIPV